MRSVFYFTLAVLALSIFAVGLWRLRTGSRPVAGAHYSAPELEYLKAVNSVRPPQDPQLLFLLMAQYSNANLPGDGAAFFSARLTEFGPRLNDSRKILYLSIIALLRAQNAPSVSLLNRVSYIKDTIAMLDQARQLSGGQVFVVNWIAGVVQSQLPGFFHRTGEAETQLAWCEANSAKAPHAGWMREVNYHLGETGPRQG